MSRRYLNLGRYGGTWIRYWRRRFEWGTRIKFEWELTLWVPILGERPAKNDTLDAERRNAGGQP